MKKSIYAYMVRYKDPELHGQYCYITGFLSKAEEFTHKMHFKKKKVYLEIYKVRCSAGVVVQESTPQDNGHDSHS